MKNYYIYNICDHQEAYKEVGAQAVSYTTEFPRTGGQDADDRCLARCGVFNIEEFDPDPFMSEIGPWGLPWQESYPETAVF